MLVGVDIEQFVRDTYGSGIQRVLQYLAWEWPTGIADAEFVVPDGDRFALLPPPVAARLLSIPFEPREPSADLRHLVRDALGELDVPRVKAGDLLALYDAWLLPEVSYLPSVLDRLRVFSASMPTVMIGYDALPMSEPSNYRFAPGAARWVSEYFRHLAAADSVVCISAYARDSILDRLRRDRARPISVAHPGGDHVAIAEGSAPSGRARFCRLGTMEARKRPVEILDAFTEASAGGIDAELVFVGAASASDESINARVRAAIDAGVPVRWVTGASDEGVRELVAESSAFLSIGTEGYGIPVLEAIRLGTPVLYDGIQPAGDVMAGRGARRVPSMTHGDLVSLFVEYASPAALGGLCAELAPDQVPRWSAFAEAVATAVADAR